MTSADKAVHIEDQVVEDMEVCNQEADNNVDHNHMENDNHIVDIVDKVEEEVDNHVDHSNVEAVETVEEVMFEEVEEKRDLLNL
jgi:hypothetical protein